MFRALLLACAAQTVIGIIVKELQPTGDEYNYGYEIENPTTGDSKSLQETRLGEAVTGRYSVLDPDGTRRIVHYTADPYKGFKAVLVQEAAFLPHTNLQEYISFDGQLPRLRTYHANPYFQFQTNLYSKPTRNQYFTPANEILSSKRAPANGLYFEPNTKTK